jgi:uncharacterized membrane protein YoaK (UPF0700 family)
MNRFDRPRQTLAISLATLAGFVDAVGFLSADSYFVSFMSGNTTRLAVDLVQTPHRAIIPALLIAGFTVGVALGSIVARLAGHWRKPAVLTFVTMLLLCAAILHAAGLVAGATGAMVLGMGAVNNTFQRDGEIAVGLTYMTGAVVRLGQGIGAMIMGERQTGWLAYLLLWAGLFAGAVAGAAAFLRAGHLVLWAATLLAGLLALAACRLTAREQA